MNNKIKIILIVCLLHITCKGQTFYQKFYKTGYHNYFSTNIFPQTDSSHLVFNYVQDSATGRQDLSILKIDKLGNELLKKTHNHFNLTYSAYLNGLKQFFPATNTSMMASGGTFTGSTTTMIFTKINKTTLDTIKTTLYYDGIFNYYLNSFIKLNDNKYYLIGGKGNTSTVWPVIFHLDSNLAIVNIITLNNPINLNTTTAILNPVTKKLVFSGTITYSINQLNIGFIEADTLGVISNTSVISFPGIQGMSQLRYSYFDDTYIFNGTLKTSKYGNNNMYRLNISKIDPATFNVLWSKTYGSASYFNNTNGFIVNPDGSIVTSGRYTDSTSLPLMNYDTKGVILKTNANGDSLWMRQYNNHIYGSSPTNYHETFFGVERTLDGGYILCGNVMNQPQAKAWIVKTDSLGCVYNGCGSVITGDSHPEFQTANAEHFSIYPNPANDVLNVNVLNTESSYDIQVTDLTGKILIKQSCNANCSISLKEMQGGVYLVNLYSNTTLISTKKVVVIK